MRKGVLERILNVRKEPDLVEELRGLQEGEFSPHLMFRCVGDGEQQSYRHVLADDCGRLEQALGFGCETVDACGKDGLHGGRHLQLLDWPSELIGAAFTGQRPRLCKRPYALLEKEWVGFRAHNQEPFERSERHGSAEEGVEKLVATFG